MVLLVLLPSLWLAQSGPVEPATLDVREPPFAHHDFSWLNGNNPQPSSLLGVGPVTFSVYVDTYYAFQFHRPSDHTIFQTTTAPRHNEVGLNLALLGVEVGGAGSPLNGRWGGPIGRFYLQAGNNLETDQGQDGTVGRGQYLTQRSLMPIYQAAGGWHFPVLHGLNIEAGLFFSYVAMESYLPQENWNYTHPFVSDFTPYYFSGLRTQLFPTRNQKLELWLVNGWQSYGKWHESPGGGYLYNWRPLEGLSLTHSLYVGREQQADPRALRVYSDNYLQLRYLHDPSGWLRSGALCVVADVGRENRSLSPSGWIVGASVSNRFEFPHKVFGTLRADVFYDQSQALVTVPPTGPTPDQIAGKEWLGGGVAATLDFWPSTWLLLRLEYSHRWVNQPYLSGRGGITPPAPSSGGDPEPDFTRDFRTSDDRVIANLTLRL